MTGKPKGMAEQIKMRESGETIQAPKSDKDDSPPPGAGGSPAEAENQQYSMLDYINPLNWSPF